MTPTILSKSRYCRGLQCPKILWLDAHKPELRDDSAIIQSTLDTGLRRLPNPQNCCILVS
jgi:hypothetical protein